MNRGRRNEGETKRREGKDGEKVIVGGEERGRREERER